MTRLEWFEAYEEYCDECYEEGRQPLPYEVWRIVIGN